MRISFLFAGAATAAALFSATPAASQAVYTDAGAFTAATSPTTYNFSFTNPNETVFSPYTLGPATFSGDFTGYNDGGYGTGVSYLGDYSTLTVTTDAASIGFFLGAYDAPETITYNVDGISGMFNVPGASDTAFLGFSGLSGSSTITFSNSAELDTVKFLASTMTAVPEPATWTMMLAGFALMGFALRRRAGASRLMRA
jgi:hypothetical protein